MEIKENKYVSWHLYELRMFRFTEKIEVLDLPGAVSSSLQHLQYCLRYLCRCIFCELSVHSSCNGKKRKTIMLVGVAQSNKDIRIKRATRT